MNFPRHACQYAERLAAECAQFRLQLEPDARELEEDDEFSSDPFGENDEASGVHGLKQRFEDRVLVMTSDSCFMNCRHCTRKGLLHSADVVRSDEELQDCLDYVKSRPEVRDILLSGGDPLVLPDDEVLRFVDAFASLEQVDVVRLCTRAPCVNPTRITDELASRLRVCGKVCLSLFFTNCVNLRLQKLEI